MTDLEIGAPLGRVSSRAPRAHALRVSASAELWQRRGLVRCFVWRDLKVRYKQTALGAVWALVQPLASMGVFTLFFGHVAHLPSDGLPYSLFSYAALLPWLFVSRAIAGASYCLVNNAELITQVYFPRVVLPLATVLSNLADYLIAIAFFFVLMPCYGYWPPLSAIVTVPALTLLMIALSLGMSLWLGAVNVKFRDVGHALSFFLQLWMFASPVTYPFALIPSRYRWIAGLNPLAGIVEGFRAALFSRSWDLPLLAISVGVTAMLLVSGAWYFHRAERSFADRV